MHWMTIAKNACLLAGLLAVGCGSDVGDVNSSSAALTSGGPDLYDCFEYEAQNSICVGNGITFFTADLHLERCKVTRAGGTVCTADPAASPGMPVEFWGSPVGKAQLSCDDGTVLDCNDSRDGSVLCNCEQEQAADGGGDDGSIVWEVVE